MILDRKPKHHIKYMYFYIILILETFFTSIFHVYFAWNQIASYYLSNIPITGGFRSHGDTLIQVIRPWKLSMPLVGSSEHRWEQFMGEPLTQMLRVWYIYSYIYIFLNQHLLQKIPSHVGKYISTKDHDHTGNGLKFISKLGGSLGRRCGFFCFVLA